MLDELHKSREYAEQIRFAGDIARDHDIETSTDDGAHSFFSQNDLQISETVTPDLAACLNRVYERLHIPAEAVSAFVYASPEMQAACFATGHQRCVIRFSSGLIDILNIEEIEFVAGHELGHFLLRHVGGCHNQESQESLQYYIHQRAKEISVDRIGLVACQSLNIALRALMKTVSGLNDKYMRFDVATFIDQLRQTKDIGSGIDATSSHPSIIVRCRALMWFSLNDFFSRGEEYYSYEQISKMDSHIQKDLDKYIDGPANACIELEKTHLTLWLVAQEIVRDGKFQKREQECINDFFGQELLDKLKNFLAGLNASEVADEVQNRIETTRTDLESLIPDSFEKEYEKILAQVPTILK